VAALAAALLTLTTVGTTPAGAHGRPVGSPAVSPVAPGPVSDLHLVGVTRSDDLYQVSVAWQAGADTSSYRVRALDAAGAVLDRASVTATTWQAEVDAGPGQQVTISVAPYHDRLRGTPDRISATLPDLTPPTGSFATTHVHRQATLTWHALADDVTSRGAIVRSVTWGDGTARQPWPSGRSIGHGYPGPGAWHPVVRLVDAAGNTALVPAPAVVVGDRRPPTGVFSASPTAGWATLSEVGLTQLSLRDDRSAPADVGRTVRWGDGDSTPWPAGEPAAHVYETDGVLTPVVRLVDEAGHHRLVRANPVTVSRDTGPPSVRLHRPPADQRSSINSWRTLEGRATDAETGAAVVRVQVAQRRRDGWYAYHPGDGAWVRASDRGDAWRHARTALVLPSPAGRWLCPVRPLRRGLLVVRVDARDNVGNTSDLLVRRQQLSSR
jgi:hypothetical protein